MLRLQEILGTGTARLLPKPPAVVLRAHQVIAVMAYLMALAVGFVLALAAATAHWDEGLSNRLTVQVVDADTVRRDLQASAALNLIKDFPGVKSASLLPDAAAEQLLEPWIGRDALQAGLPVPSLIDVTMTGHDTLDVAALRVRLREAAPGARVDDHAQWLRELARLAAAARGFGIWILLLVGASLVAVVSVTTRTALAEQRDAIEILHMLGAPDRMIAGDFQKQFFLQGLKGGALGVVFAILSLWGLGALAGSVLEGLVVGPLIGVWTLAALALLLPLVASMTLAAARLTVLATLRALP